MSYPVFHMAMASSGTYRARLDDIAERSPNRVAFRLKTPKGYRATTYKEVHDQSYGVAHALVSMGLQPGERAAVLSENRPEWPIAYLGICFAAGTVVPLDTQISPQEWRRLLEDSESKAVFVSGLLLENLIDAVRDLDPRPEIICFDPREGGHAACISLSDFISGSDASPNTLPPLPQSRMSDVLVIIYTSGTTGKPKGVMLTQANIIGEIDAVLAAVHAGEEDTLLCLLPLQHVLASVLNALLPMYVGGQVVFADTLKRSEILAALEESGITILLAVPQFFYLFHNRIKEELEKKPILARKLFRAMLWINRHSMRLLHVNLGKIFFARIHRLFGRKLRLFVSGGSAFDPDVAQDFHSLGFTILQGYGLTETTGGCTVTRAESNVVGSVGTALPNVEIKILDPDEHGVGEVLIRGPIVMKGYYRNPQGTIEAISDGWFHSGDLGRMDGRGNLFITGRQKEVIVLPSGKNIYPDELEAHYQKCPFIQEIAVLGVTEAAGHGTSERLHAVVVPNFEYLKARKIANTREILRDEIARYSNQLPKYKRLMSYQIQKEPLPRTTTRKIKRLELKQLIEGGRLQGLVPAHDEEESAPAEAALAESAVGQVVIGCLMRTFHRDGPIDARMNLELDLGFDSMSRVELLSNLENELQITLAEDFHAEIFTVGDLVARLEAQVRSPAIGSASERKGWQTILSAESLSLEREWSGRFTGSFLSLVKFLLLRLIHYCLFKVFLRLETRGVEHLPKQGPYLLCPNHLSYIDSFVLLSVLPYETFRRVFFVGASEYFTNWFTRLLARLANIVAVDPDAHLLRAMKVGAYGLRQGWVLCIFPEGARSFDGEMKEFKKGAAILAREVQVPLVPVGIKGTYEVWARDSMRIRPHKVKVAFGPPFFPDSGAAETDPYQADTDRLRNTVVQLIR